MGRPKGSKNKSTLARTTAVQVVPAEETAVDAVANVLAERCGIPGCGPRIHKDEAEYLVRRFQSIGVLKVGD